MRIYFGSIFIEREKLKEEGINYPIKLEYYKIINEDEMIKNENFKFGVEIGKTEYIGENIRFEKEEMKYVSNDEQKVDKLLELLKRNEVTPICMREIIYDFFQSYFLLNK